MLKLFPILLVCLVPFTINSVESQWNPNFAPGRTTMVHLFEWRWNDIAEECERFLSPSGFAGVQVSPPNENRIVAEGAVNNRPWWERYQPVSYKLETRSGTELEFATMVRRCNAVNVRIYVDAVINHMTGGGSGVGTGGSSYDTNSLSFPGVPYSSLDFHGPECPTPSGQIEDYSNPQQVRYCKLVGLTDLGQEKLYVQEKIVEFFNRLIGYGVAGFRIDASKHMEPKDMATILGKLNNLSTDHGFPANTRAFVFQEVIDLGNEPITSDEYIGNGRVTEFKYGRDLGTVVRKQNNQKLSFLKNFGEGWGMLDDNNSLVFVDNHDNQRGHGAGGASILTFRESKLYKIGVSFMLAWPYGVSRVMSSYFWEQDWQDGVDKNDWIGPPHDDSMNTLPVVIKPDMTCDNGWICEHRWRQIYNMAKFRNVVAGTPVTNWWDNLSNQVAFCRGNKGFIVINNDEHDLYETLQTCLPNGVYCDIISGGLENGRCTGTSVIVGNDGMAFITLEWAQEDPVLAIHIDSKLS